MAARTIPFKLVLLGDAAVGKSSLVLRFVKRQFFEYQESTIGSAFLSQTVQLEDALIKFEIWDTAGQERYQGLAPMYYRGAAAALVVYDITSVSSFQRAQSWIQELQSQASNNIVILLIGNKTDMAHKRMVSTDMAKSYAEENNVTYFETSAKTNDNVSEVFMHLARTLPRGNEQAKTSNNIVIDSDYKGRKSRCC